MADTPAFRAELALVQQQLSEVTSRHECRALLVVLHPDGSLNRISNMSEDHVKRVCAYIGRTDNSKQLPDLIPPGAAH